MHKIAKVLKSNGTDGGVLLGVLDMEEGRIDTKEPVFIFFDGLPVPFFILDISPKGTGKAVVHFNDVHSLEDAEELVGRPIYAGGEAAAEEEEDFTGWTVYDREFLLGTVSGMEPIPGNLCLYIDYGGKEILIPLNEDFILDADPSARTLRLSLPEGLY